MVASWLLFCREDNPFTLLWLPFHLMAIFCASHKYKADRTLILPISPDCQTV